MVDFVWHGLLVVGFRKQFSPGCHQFQIWNQGSSSQSPQLEPVGVALAMTNSNCRLATLCECRLTNGFRLARIDHSETLCFDVWPSIEELKELLKELLRSRTLSSLLAKNHTADLEALQSLARSVIQNSQVCINCP